MEESKYKRFVHEMERAGWRVVHVAIDLPHEVAHVELRRVDRLITLKSDVLGASITRDALVRQRANVRGLPVLRVRTTLIGRTRRSGVRGAMRWLATYIAQNSARGSVTEQEVRNAFRGLLR